MTHFEKHCFDMSDPWIAWGKICAEIFAREHVLIITLYNHDHTMVFQLVCLSLAKHSITLTEFYYIICSDIANENLVDVQIFGLRDIVSRVAVLP